MTLFHALIQWSGRLRVTILQVHIINGVNYLSIGLQTPAIMPFNESTVIDGLYDVTVQWMTDDSIDIQYVLSVINSTNYDPLNITTELTSWTFTLQVGVDYYIAVTAQQCGGTLTSNASNILHLFQQGNSK